MASLNSTEAQEGVAKSGYFPQLAATFGWQHQNLATFNPAFSPTAVVDNFTGLLSLNQNIFNGMQDLEKFRQAKELTLAAQASLRATKAQVSFNLKTAYEGYVYARSFQKLTADIIHRRYENLRIVELRFQSGRENKGSVMLSQANLNQAKFDDLQARDLKEVARVQLRKALGFEEGQEIDVSEEIPVRNWDTRLPDFIRLANQAPDFLQALHNEVASEHAASAARGTFFPQLTFNSQAGTGGNDFYPHVPQWQIGLNLTLNVLNGGKDYANLQSAAYTRAQNESQRISTNLQDVVNLRQNYISLIEAIEKLKVDLSYKQAEEVRAEIARKKYNNGLLSFEDWNLIEDDLITRQKNYLQSLQNRVLSEASWEQAQGTGVIP